MAEVLKIQYNDTTNPARLIVSGEVDLCTIDQFAIALSDAAARHSRILIDLTEVDFLACVGIDVLYNHTSNGRGAGPARQHYRSGVGAVRFQCAGCGASG